MNIFSQSKPFIIAGPCAAEDEEQMQSIAHSFKDSSINMIRAGVWKPRSKPGFFEGRGEIALKWLQTVKEISGKQVCTEIATPEQIELALKYNLDTVWIGARTTVNPFVVQELADALKGCNMAVLVKNPINPDIELWSGAVERIQKAGIENIAAIPITNGNSGKK
jgi:chorismate mutase